MFLTSGFVHPHSRVTPVRAPEVGRAHSHRGWRWFGLGRCRQHVAQHPCTERDINHSKSTYLGAYVKPWRKVSERQKSELKKERERVKVCALRKRLGPDLWRIGLVGLLLLVWVCVCCSNLLLSKLASINKNICLSTHFHSSTYPVTRR